jgi:hypothetical protein
VPGACACLCVLVCQELLLAQLPIALAAMGKHQGEAQVVEEGIALIANLARVDKNKVCACNHAGIAIPSCNCFSLSDASAYCCVDRKHCETQCAQL